MKSFFDEANRLSRMSELGDPLVKLNSVVNWEIFRPELESFFPSCPEKQGRRPWDAVLMFKIQILQEMYNISDDRTEYQINDRLSFQRFLGLELGDNVPDAKTIWKYRELLVKGDVHRKLFKLFNAMLEEKEIITHKGTIVDATIVERTRQRMTKEEREEIKKGEIPKSISDNAHKLSQKDLEASGTQKHGKKYYGYKNHVKADEDSKLILDYRVTGAKTHDSTQIAEMVDETDRKIKADSAYRGKSIAKAIKAKNRKVRMDIGCKNEKNRRMTEKQKEHNSRLSRTRCRIEHIFGHMVKAMGGKLIRVIGLSRAACKIGLKNLAYNMQRYCFLSTSKTALGQKYA
ncbi:MAG: IS5 family transposase [Clostridiales bacterium]|jgi:IS5 family transposase|nr:IS5 family transposase [Clostridiales bacterium]